MRVLSYGRAAASLLRTLTDTPVDAKDSAAAAPAAPPPMMTTKRVDKVCRHNLS
jgi:hypothetical protein